MRVLPCRGRARISDFTAGDFYDLIVLVGEVAGTIVGGAKLIEIMRRGLRDCQPRRGKVYLTNGEEHKCSLDAEDE